MKLSQTSVGLTVRVLRAAAGLTLNDLSKQTGISTSSLSRGENGLHDFTFVEVIVITEALKIDVKTFHTLIETFERADIIKKRECISKLEHDLVQTVCKSREKM